MTKLNIQVPLKKIKVYEKIDNQGTLGKQIAVELEAAGFAMRDGIPNILFDKKTKWYDIFKTDYENQPNFSRETDIYEISQSANEVVGSWEGFVTSFIWRKIQFKNVFVQLILDKRYYLPLELITQIKEKVNVRYNTFNPNTVEQKPIYMNWDKSPDPKNIDYNANFMGTIIN